MGTVPRFLRPISQFYIDRKFHIGLIWSRSKCSNRPHRNAIKHHEMKKDAKSARLAENSLGAVRGVQSEKNRKILQPVLTDLIALGRVLKQLHWNVVGPHFRPIHLQLDDIYELVDDAVDKVAERMVATGHSPDGRLKNSADSAEIEDAPPGFLADTEVLLFAEHSVKRTDELIRARCEEIEDVDTATADMLHQIILGLEKYHWMLQAHRL
jgi:starvation-inducible DNA-binding protein